MYSQKKSRWGLYLTTAALIAVVSFTGGYGIGILQKTILDDDPIQQNFKKTESTTQANVDFGLFWEVWNLVKDKHVNQPVDDIDLFYGAIGGIAAAVDDPYTVYLPPELTARFTEDISGKFDGIGAEIGIKDSQLQIIAPLAGTPAEQAGLLAGDYIIKIDGLDTIGLTIDEAVDKIRGPKGSTVILTIYRNGADDVTDISVIRDTIKIPTLEYELRDINGKRLAIITLSHFNEDASEDFAEIVQTVLRDNPDGIILDMRNNPGGLLTESVAIASYFIPDGPIVNERFSDGREKSYPSDGYGTLKNYKTAVLINQGSASAAEIVAGALKDYQIAKIIGKTSYGKGSVQDFQVLDDNSSLKITVAHWYTPHGNSINDSGITPDIEVDLTIEDIEAERDPQLDRAIEELVN